MAKYKTAFYAYPSKPDQLGETIEAAATRINNKLKSRQIRVRTWKQLTIAGKPIIDQVLRGISDADIFACDLTYPNPNVLFELGYAVGKLKRIWISLDATVIEAKESFRHLSSTLVPDVGYVTYTNSEELSTQLINTRPWADPHKHLLGSGFDLKANRPPYHALYYLRQPYDTDASLVLTEALQGSAFSQGLVIDNPKDNPSSTLNWYAEKIRDTDALVVHLLSQSHEGHLRHNQRCAFIAGLGRALHDNVLMLAPSPYSTPLDYRSILRIHDTASECHKLVTNWLADVSARIPKKRPRQDVEVRPAKSVLDLRNLRVGEHVAEFERVSLDQYFVETSAYHMALDCEQAIFVGRRGTGKTATLFALARGLSDAPSTHVCVIKPVGYEVDGIIRVLQQVLHKAERGYLLESFWKLLIYTELALSVANEVRNRRPDEAHLYDEGEERLLEFITTYAHLIELPFSIRVDRAIAPLMDIGAMTDVEEQRIRISERLHVGLIRDLREVLGRALCNRKRVAILIDNLDEPWSPGAHVEYLADLLLGLLRVARDIGEEFHRSDHWRRPVNVTVIVFIRSDIFYHVQRVAVEQDKLPVHILYWDERESLLRVIETRLENATDGRAAAAEIWRTMFADSVSGMAPKDFITAFALPRPRDIIYLVREALSTATNRQHAIVTEVDLFDARRRYSEFAFTSILAEDDPLRGKLESVLTEFAGAPPTMRRSEVESTLRTAGLSGDDVDFYIDLLCDLNFLGIESGDGYRYPRHEGERRLFRELARKAAARREGSEAEESYEINRAFHDVLQIR